MKKSIPLMSIALIFVTTFSCQEESFEVDRQKSVLEKVHVQDGYLQVDEQLLPDVINELQGMSPSELKDWEKSIGFTSLRSIMDKAVEEETKYFAMLEAMGENNLDISTTAPHAPFVMENQRYFNFTSEGWFELKVLDQRLSSLLNPSGVIKLGNELRKYQDDLLFISKTGDLASLQKHLSLSHLPSDVEGFQITKYRKVRNLSNERVITSSMNINSCTGRTGDYRVRLYEDVVTRPLGSGSWELQHQFILKSFRHTVFGWQRNFATSALEGGVYFEADWGNGSDYIYANGTQHEIGAVLVTGYQYSESTPPSIYYSRGEGWGRDGCNCNYSANY